MEGINTLIAISAPTALEKVEYHFWELSLENDIVYNLRGGKIGKGVRPGPFWLKKNRPVDCVEKLKAPVLYMHGKEDWLIKPWHSQALFDKTLVKKRLVLIKNGPHAEYLMRKHKAETVGAIKEWLEETL